MFKKLFDFFIFSSLYIGLCAVLMTVQSLQLLYQHPASRNLLLFVFFSTICSYNFHWYLTPRSVSYSKRIEWTQDHRALHLILTLGGLAGAGIFFYLLRDYWIAIAVGTFFTFLYSAPKLPQSLFRDLKKIAIGKTLFLAFVWMYVTTVLPVVLSRDPQTPAFILFACSRFFLIYAICILFDYRDREDDKKENIRSMITYFNERGINNLFAISLLLFAICTLWLHVYGYSLFLIMVLLIPGIILASLYSYAKKNFSDYLYYFVLDGLMMLSGLFTLVFRI